ncbi:MAG: GNAT family N-acetyltransferase [Planctomycetota bacterium]
MNPTNLIVDESGPTPAEYCELRAINDMSKRTISVAEQALPHSLLSLALRDQSGVCIAMGRVVGDGASWFVIVDIAVRPEHHSGGIGTHLMRIMMRWIAERAEESAAIILQADIPADRLYARFGFRHTAPGTVGMSIHVGRTPFDPEGNLGSQIL